MQHVVTQAMQIQEQNGQDKPQVQLEDNPFHPLTHKEGEGLAESGLLPLL